MVLLELHEVSLQRGGQGILEGISWSIAAGQHWAILGANGAGKTMLLKILTGYEWATGGQVRVLGQTYGNCDLPQLRRRIGLVSAALEYRLPPEDSALNIVLSGFEASLGLYREFSPAEKKEAQKALDFLAAGHLADALWGRLSQGEQQRVLIARSLVARPAALILDEPCVGLDPVARQLFLEDMAALAQRDGAPTMLWVTHHIEEIGSWITHALVLKSGRILAQGPLAEVLCTKVMTQAFNDPRYEDRGCRCKVRRNGRGYHLMFDPGA